MYKKFGKRLLDLCFAFIGLAICSIPLTICSVLVWFTSGRPILYRQARIGRNGRTFRICKFRTMHPHSSDAGTITSANDCRVTPIGHLLRKSKLDELPQLWNVLLGEMSFVGPRPDVPGYADKLTGPARAILNLRPGITGPATLAFREEEQILAQVDDPKEFNDEVIFPKKVQINLAYIGECSLIADIKYIWRTFAGK